MKWSIDRDLLKWSNYLGNIYSRLCRDRRDETGGYRGLGPGHRAGQPSKLAQSRNYNRKMNSALLSWLQSLPPISFASSSMGCLRAVMSLKVQRNRTTTSLSFLIGEMCISSHSGVPGQWSMLLHKGMSNYLEHIFGELLHQPTSKLTFDKILYSIHPVPFYPIATLFKYL